MTASLGDIITVRINSRDVFAANLDSRFLFNSAEVLLTANDDFDNANRDSFLQFTVPVAGDYFIQVSDIVNQGGNYRIFINNDRQLDIVTDNADNIIGNDTDNLLVGGGGADIISALGGNDVIEGGTGTDFINGGAGADLNIWTNGDGSDVFDGGSDVDTQQFFGSFLQGDTLTLTNVGGNGTLNRTNLVPVTIIMPNVENVEVFGGGAVDDSLTVGNLAGTAVTSILFDGGTGHDLETTAHRYDTLNAAPLHVDLTARGRDGNDTLIGGFGRRPFGGRGGRRRAQW